MAKKADCPECEYCCAIGVCCPPAAQLSALTTLFAKATGESEADCAKYAQALVDARARAQEA